MLYQGLMEKLLASSFRIIDILPERVPAESNERYGAVEQYFLQPERLLDQLAQAAGLFLWK